METSPFYSASKRPDCAKNKSTQARAFVHFASEMKRDAVLLPYRLTLLSNSLFKGNRPQWFYYPIDLHYSQTTSVTPFICGRFYYPIDLHYSQTCMDKLICWRRFYYPINLHYEVQIRFYQNRRFIRPHRCAKNGCRLIRQPFLIHKVAGNFHIYGKSTRIALYF